MGPFLPYDSPDPGAGGAHGGQVRSEGILACPVKFVAVEVLLAFLRFGGRSPERDDVVHHFVACRYFDERDSAFAPVALRFDPHARALLVEHAIVLVLLEVPLALHQAESMWTVIGVAVDTHGGWIRQRPPDPFARSGPDLQAVRVMNLG